MTTNYLARFVTVFLLLCSLAFGQSRAVSDSQTAVSTPTTLTFPDAISTSAVTLEVIISGTAPNTISVVTSGCMRGGTCDSALDTYTTVANSVRKIQPLTVYDQYRVVISWTVGDASTNVKINRLAAVAKFGGVSGTGTPNTLAMFNGTSSIANSPLSTNGTLLSSSQTFRLPDGSACNTPAYSFTNSTNSGLVLLSGVPQVCAAGSLVASFSNNGLSATGVNNTNSGISAGADGTVSGSGTEIRRVIYKITVTGTTCANAAGFIAASLNADCTIATFPAKTEITRIIVDNTVGFTCSSVCTGTKTVQVGKTVGGTEFVLAKDATVIATYGLVNGDLGASLATSATTPVLGGDIPSWTTTTAIKARFVSGTGNWGNGAATTVNAGSTTFYIETLVFP